MTVAAAVSEAIEILVRAGFSRDEARRDTGVLGRALLGWDAARWYAHQADDLATQTHHELLAGARRRATHEPVAYITGEREFYGRSFLVTRDVLIPRPETELIVETALELVPHGARSTGESVDIVDVGTGSGCLAITLACEWPRARIVASDTSADALSIAVQNATRLGVQDRIAFVCASLAGDVSEACDLLVSNPPYVRRIDRDALAVDVRDHEPDAALYGGDDGLQVIEALVPAALRALRPNGLLLMEIGYQQADDVQGLIAGSGLQWIETRRDLNGIPRVVVARRKVL
ncbi:MAG: peptide chain release factor N(5)-glutamine methyltransferase [Vicinamibacterales bacterium]